jgi:HD-GYP domain-containing protein (c-di-GMP phosphodiesterase class II)
MNHDTSRRFLEIALIVIVLGTTALFEKIPGYKLVTLHLFYLPVILGGFFLGRYYAGVLALLCVLSTSICTALNLGDVALFTPPIVVGLMIAVWAGTLGLSSLLVGTLSDDRLAKMRDLHEAYVGVVEVLAKYLQSANPRLTVRSVRVAALCHKVAQELHLSPKEVDDIRVAALLRDLGKIEVTTRVIHKAVDLLEEDGAAQEQGTFQGIDLVNSLAPVLRGAFPLILNQDEAELHFPDTKDDPDLGGVPIGVQVFRTVLA